MSTDDRSRMIARAAEAIAESCRRHGPHTRRALRLIVPSVGAPFGVTDTAINRAVAFGWITPSDDGRTWEATDTDGTELAA